MAKRASLIVNLAVFFAIAAFPQAPSATAFEVASVKYDDRKAGSWVRYLPGGHLDASSWIKQVIQLAYGVQDYQVSGGPDWLGSDWYDIQAKADNPDATKSDINKMLQSLLADRFKLRLHTEAKEFPVYHLLVGKNGPKLRPLKDGEASRCGRDNSYACGITTVAQLADQLKHFVSRPVLDRTGVDGRYDILLDFDTYSGGNQTPPPDYNKPSLTTALQEQLGLRLEAQKASFPVLVIDSIQRPTEN